MEMKISEILSKYDTDKNKGHHYGGVYDALFEKFNRLDNLNILEIGIQKGGSLLAWREYFPNAKITGIDIADSVQENYRSDSINYVIKDVNKYRTDELFDIVIDDGSHWLKDVVQSVVYFAHKLTPHGIMVIEDVQRPDVWVSTIGNILSTELEYNLGKRFWIELYDLRPAAGLSDDFIIVIRNEHVQNSSD